MGELYMGPIPEISGFGNWQRYFIVFSDGLVFLVFYKSRFLSFSSRLPKLAHSSCPFYKTKQKQNIKEGGLFILSYGPFKLI